ncbi:MAG: AAA family ATPase [Prevotellaceae bacterium]|nr:AAA family ATPase [Prevotellaceae bacterium]
MFDEDNKENYMEYSSIFRDKTSDEYYPIGLFNLKLRQLDFENITLLYGGNGCGKTTLLNIVAETIELARPKEYVRTDMFEYFVRKCTYEQEIAIPKRSKLLASDDIFDNILSIRSDNRTLKTAKTHAYDDVRSIKSINLSNPDDLRDIRLQNEARRLTKRQFIKRRVGEMQRQYSNGENALMFFDKQIEENALYLLDEPENSMSPQLQLELKTLIEDSVRYKNCQFVIATHSPFILALKNAKIYNLDAVPVTVEKWYQLENMRIYYDFFKSYEDCFVNGHKIN